MLLALLVSEVDGARKTYTSWVEQKAAYRSEGLFLVSGPPHSLLYSTLPANWFLTGIVRLYPDAVNRVYLRDDLPRDRTMLETLRQFPTVFVQDKGRIVADPKLYDELLKAGEASLK